MMEVCASMMNHMVTLTATREISSTERLESVLATVSSRVRLTLAFCARSIGGMVDDSKIIDPYRCGNDAAGGALLVSAWRIVESTELTTSPVGRFQTPVLCGLRTFAELVSQRGA